MSLNINDLCVKLGSFPSPPHPIQADRSFFFSDTSPLLIILVVLLYLLLKSHLFQVVSLLFQPSPLPINPLMLYLQILILLTYSQFHIFPQHPKIDLPELSKSPVMLKITATTYLLWVPLTWYHLLLPQFPLHVVYTPLFLLHPSL